MIRTMFISFWVNLFLTIGKIVVGYIGFNHALIADGVSSFSDMITDIIAVIGGNIAKRHPNKKHPFGYGKAEYVVSFLVGVIVILLGLFIILNLSTDYYNQPKSFTLIFIVIFIIIKMKLVNFLYKVGKALNNQLILDSMLESKNDIYGSFLVLASTSLMFLVEYIPVFIYADLCASIIISLLIFKTGYTIIRHNMGNLIDKNHSGSVYDKTKEIILSHKEIHSIKKIYIMRYGNYYQLIGEILFKKDIHISKAHDIVELINKELKGINVKYTFIEVDSI